MLNIALGPFSQQRFHISDSVCIYIFTVHFIYPYVNEFILLDSTTSSHDASFHITYMHFNFYFPCAVVESLDNISESGTMQKQVPYRIDAV